MTNNYKKQLSAPEWNIKRLEILNRDTCCTICMSKESLQVHHKKYISNLKAWEYPNEYLVTLCSSCHNKYHGNQNISTSNSNPFIDDLFIEIKGFKSNDTDVHIEKEVYTKLYKTSEKRKLFFSLREKSRSLLTWIFYTIKPGEDIIFLNKDLYMKEANVSINTFKEAVKELIETKFICNTDIKEYYWINPVYFFSGNRLKKYADKVSIVPSKNNL